MNSNKSKVRLTKSPKAFLISVAMTMAVLAVLTGFLVWTSVDSLLLRGAVLLFIAALFAFVVDRLFRLSEAYYVTDMIIIEPSVGKKLITPLQGIVLKKSMISAVLPICKIHVRLDGKKSVHFLYGKCDELMREKVKIEDFLLELKKNKKVNRKPGSVSSVA